MTEAEGMIAAETIVVEMMIGSLEVFTVAAYSNLRATMIAAPAPASAGAPGAPGPAEPQIQHDEEAYKKDWHTEWSNGDYPSYKKTYSEDTFPGRAAVVAAEDSQSDGKPGLTGAHVGAYLKHEDDGTIER